MSVDDSQKGRDFSAFLGNSLMQHNDSLFTFWLLSTSTGPYEEKNRCLEGCC